MDIRAARKQAILLIGIATRCDQKYVEGCRKQRIFAGKTRLLLIALRDKIQSKNTKMMS
jgi:hypothetical protein